MDTTIKKLEKDVDLWINSLKPGGSPTGVPTTGNLMKDRILESLEGSFGIDLSELIKRVKKNYGLSITSEDVESVPGLTVLDDKIYVGAPDRSFWVVTAGDQPEGVTDEKVLPGGSKIFLVPNLRVGLEVYKGFEDNDMILDPEINAFLFLIYGEQAKKEREKEARRQRLFESFSALEF